MKRRAKEIFPIFSALSLHTHFYQTSSPSTHQYPYVSHLSSYRYLNEVPSARFAALAECFVSLSSAIRMHHSLEGGEVFELPRQHEVRRKRRRKGV